MLSIQSDARNYNLQQQSQLSNSTGITRASFNAADESFELKSESSSNFKPFIKASPDSREEEDVHLALSHQMYKAGSYKQALEHSNTVYERNPLRTDNLLLLGAIYYQLHDFEMCIVKNEEALRIEPHFAECFGNMANAWKEKGNIDLAIRYYLIAIEGIKEK